MQQLIDDKIKKYEDAITRLTDKMKNLDDLSHDYTDCLATKCAYMGFILDFHEIKTALTNMTY